MTALSAPPEPARRAPAVVAAGPEVAPLRRPPRLALWLTAGWLALIVVGALTVSFLPLSDYDLPAAAPKQPPLSGGLDLLLGSDANGRSMLTRILVGARVSLIVGLVAGVGGMLIGASLGVLAGWFRGWVDRVLGVLSDAMLAFPPLVLLLALSAVLTPSITTLLLGLTALVVPSFFRLARANTLAWSSREFITSARNMGAGDLRIVLREIVPNVIGPVATYLPVVIAALIVAEGSLSFLGLGVPPPTPSWGGMINAGRDSMEEFPYLVWVPALAIFLTVFSLNTLGDHLRARFDDPGRS